MTHNGTQDLVLAAIRARCREIAEIQRTTGLDVGAIENAVRRLKDAGLVKRSDGHIVPVDRCLLAEVWK